MAYIGNSVVGVEHPSTSALNATTGAFTGNVTTTGTVEPAGDTAAGDDAAIGYTSAEGLILTGQGSTSDITLKNDADATVFTVPTGTDDILFPDSAEIQMGAGADLKVSSDGTNGVLRANNGRVYIQTDTGVNLTKTGNAETMLIATPDGSVDLYHNNSKKIETTSSGVDVTGTVTSDGLTVDSGTTVLSGTVTNQTSSSYATNDGGIDNILSLNSTGSSNTQSCGIQFSLTKSGQTGAISEIGAIRESSGNSGLVFRTRDSGTGRNERMRIDSSGNLLVGATAIADGNNSTCTISTGGTISTSRAATNSQSHHVFYNPNGSVGNIATNGSATAYNTSSDYRLKTAVNYDWDATTRLKQLRPARFKWIADGDNAVPVDGFLAHEAAIICPESVTGTKDEVEVWKDGEELPDGVSVGDNKLDADGNTIPVMQGIDQAKIVPLLTKALIESVTKIEALEARITALENA